MTDPLDQSRVPTPAEALDTVLSYALHHRLWGTFLSIRPRTSAPILPLCIPQDVHAPQTLGLETTRLDWRNMRRVLLMVCRQILAQ